LIEERVGVEKGIQRVVRDWLAKVGIVEVVGVRHGVLWWRMFGMFGLGSLRITREVHQSSRVSVEVFVDVRRWMYRCCQE
jgi:hypothetical protein